MIEVKVKYDPATGEINIEGPWDDGILFLGMLDMAKCAFYESHSKGPTSAKMTNKIVIPDLMVGGKKPS